MGKIQGAELIIYSYQDGQITIDLEYWQLKAIIEILGLSVEFKGDSTYDVIMLGEKGVQMLLDSIPYKVVRNSEIGQMALRPKKNKSDPLR